jgi:hypothetical protein
MQQEEHTHNEHCKDVEPCESGWVNFVFLDLVQVVLTSTIGQRMGVDCSSQSQCQTSLYGGLGDLHAMPSLQDYCYERVHLSVHQLHVCG